MPPKVTVAPGLAGVPADPDKLFDSFISDFCGNIARDFTIPAKPVIKGDGKCPSIAAASILAKVERDRFCRELDGFYPEYGFAAHKGYATKAHIAAIRKYGPCPAHRASFLRKVLKDLEQQNLI